MANNALIQTRIDANVKKRAAAVFERLGLTVSDAVRILLTRTARDGVAPMDLLVEQCAYDAWFRARVHEALKDSRPDIPDNRVAEKFGRLRRNARKGIKPA
jgi:DNA-damage-inducible protein J